MEHILVTGGAGFLGHHLINYLLKYTNYTITILDRIDESSNLNRVSELVSYKKYNKRVTFIWHDLKAEINDSLSNMIQQPNIIIHLAAGSHVDRSNQDPALFVLDNVLGTCNLLTYAKKLDKLDKFIYFSTDEVFGPAKQGQKFKEWDRYNSGNPYSATKAGAEELCIAFYNTYKLPVIITHCMNMFGERQHKEKFLPLLINKIQKKETIKIHTNLEQKPGSRYWIYAEEVCDAIIKLINLGIIGDKYNIIGSKEINNLELAILVSNYLNISLKYKLCLDRGEGYGYDFRYDIEDNKMKELGWNPSLDVEDKIKKVVQWYINNLKWL